ncbi:MAG: NADH-quinone oxidoreductase subunit L, partial [Mycolicibacterium sp.]
AYRKYATTPIPTEVPDGSTLTHAARHDLYSDTLNEKVFMRPGAGLVERAVTVNDRGIDAAVSAVAAVVALLSHRLRVWHSGFARVYALFVLTGAALVVAVLQLARY